MKALSTSTFRSSDLYPDSNKNHIIMFLSLGLLETAQGDFVLSPAYDLLNTKLHVDDPDFALDGGLFADGFKSGDWKKNAAPSHLDFEEFARRIGIQEKRIKVLLEPFLLGQPLVEQLIGRSFLNDSLKRGYLINYNKKRNLLCCN
ncbi:MAG: hypothetical protein ABWY16_08535 [Pedobacter sp.]|uniref:hypothetical protein n=1 Tax=Pedobacter sp. TaxID=1411316 RepID=UPI00339638D9